MSKQKDQNSLAKTIQAESDHTKRPKREKKGEYYNRKYGALPSRLLAKKYITEVRTPFGTHSLWLELLSGALDTGWIEPTYLSSK